jgi:hypothetical protein
MLARVTQWTYVRLVRNEQSIVGVLAPDSSVLHVASSSLLASPEASFSRSLAFPGLRRLTCGQFPYGAVQYRSFQAITYGTA